MGVARALHVPEAEVDVPAALHRVEREAAFGNPDRADPLRPELDCLCIKLQELGGARDRDVDVLDHRLGMQAEQTLELLRHAGAAVPAHYWCRSLRRAALAARYAAHEGALREHSPRTRHT